MRQPPFPLRAHLLGKRCWSFKVDFSAIDLVLAVQPFIDNTPDFATSSDLQLNGWYIIDAKRRGL